MAATWAGSSAGQSWEEGGVMQVMPLMDIEHHATSDQCQYCECCDPLLHYFGQRKAHAPLEAGWEDSLGVRVQTTLNRIKHRRFQWLHDAIGESG